MIVFLQEVYSELLKVSWPSRNDTIRLTAVVIAISLFVGLYLGAVDYIFQQMLGYIVK